MANNSSSTHEQAEETPLPDLPAVGVLIAERRKELALTLHEASERLDVGRRLLFELEHGRRAVRADTLLRVLKTLGYDIIARRKGGIRGMLF